jgi:DNA-binding MarR family transcriptional regulator
MQDVSANRKHRRPLRLEEFLPYRLSLLSNTVSGVIASTYEDKFGISMPEWRIMMMLAEYPGIAAEEICRRTRIEKSVVSRALARLLKRRLVTRETSAQDRRRQVLHLTETGLAVYDEVMPVAREYERQLLRGLNAADRAALDRLLDALQERADELR